MAQYCHASHEVNHEGVAQRAHNLSPVPFGAAKRAKESTRLMRSIMRASLRGLTISHLCLSALPSERKKVPTTAQTPLRRRWCMHAVTAVEVLLRRLVQQQAAA